MIALSDLRRARADTMNAARLAMKMSAVCLVLLIALPFTAPFSACDIATRFSPAAGSTLPAAADTGSQAAAPADSAVSRLFPTARESARLRLLLVSGVRHAVPIPDPILASIGGPIADAARASSSPQRSILRI
jgi:hypothetical protein